MKQILILLPFMISVVWIDGCAMTQDQKDEPVVKSMIVEGKVDEFVHPDSSITMRRWCQELNEQISEWKWDLQPCQIERFKIDGQSVEGRELVYWDFGNPNSTNTTLVFSMVHGDEVTPLYVALKLAEWLAADASHFGDNRVIIAPLVNPDGFYKNTRTNARGVDVNRNFATKDWEEKAIKSWKQRFNATARRNPGVEPNSEPETKFQKFLIEKYEPQKILSVHAPLNFMDYDGPSVLSLSKFSREYVKKCVELKKKLGAVHGGYYPGSLGNYAGQERGIPTLTLELPSANPNDAQKYWKTFESGIEKVIKFKVPEAAVVYNQ